MRPCHRGARPGLVSPVGYRPRRRRPSFRRAQRLADIYARRGELARAERELLSATDDIDHWRARLGDVEVRSLAFQTAVTIEASAFEPAANGVRAARCSVPLPTPDASTSHSRSLNDGARVIYQIA